MDLVGGWCDQFHAGIDSVLWHGRQSLALGEPARTRRGLRQFATTQPVCEFDQHRFGCAGRVGGETRFFPSHAMAGVGFGWPAGGGERVVVIADRVAAAGFAVCVVH